MAIWCAVQVLVVCMWYFFLSVIPFVLSTVLFPSVMTHSDHKRVGINQDLDETDSVKTAHCPVLINHHDDLSKELKSWDDFLVDWERYKQATFQTFIVGKSDKLAAAHHLSKQLQYMRASFACVHHGGYVAKGTGQRKFLHTRRTGCTAEISVAAELKKKVLARESQGRQLS